MEPDAVPQMFGVYGLNQFQLAWRTEAEAVAEAQRLSLKSPGKTFVVFAPIHTVKDGETKQG